MYIIMKALNGFLVYISALFSAITMNSVKTEITEWKVFKRSYSSCIQYDRPSQHSRASCILPVQCEPHAWTACDNKHLGYAMLLTRPTALFDNTNVTVNLSSSRIRLKALNVQRSGVLCCKYITMYTVTAWPPIPATAGMFPLHHLHVMSFNVHCFQNKSVNKINSAVLVLRCALSPVHTSDYGRRFRGTATIVASVDRALRLLRQLSHLARRHVT